MPHPRLPHARQSAWPVLRALGEVGGGPVSVGEINERANQYLSLTAAQVAAMRPNRSQTQAAGEASWARALLRWVGLAEPVRPGMWRLTRKGRELFTDSANDDRLLEAYVHGLVRGAQLRDGQRSREIKRLKAQLTGPETGRGTPIVH